jgi:hypothetical protein
MTDQTAQARTAQYRSPGRKNLIPFADPGKPRHLSTRIIILDCYLRGVVDRELALSALADNEMTLEEGGLAIQQVEEHFSQ